MCVSHMIATTPDSRPSSPPAASDSYMWAVFWVRTNRCDRANQIYLTLDLYVLYWCVFHMYAKATPIRSTIAAGAARPATDDVGGGAVVAAAVVATVVGACVPVA